MLLLAIGKNENPVFTPFVLPNYCAKLKELGFPIDTVHQWKVYPDKLSLTTYAFDDDDYYREGNRIKDLLFPGVCQFPAYTIKDMERCIPAPSYELNMEGGVYCLTFVVSNKAFKFTDNRMPDVFAKALIAMGVNDMINLIVVKELIVGK